MALLTKRYEEEKLPLTEQEMWERDQQKKVVTGSRSSRHRKE